LSGHWESIMFELKISPAALGDLLEIKQYISQELDNEQAAIKLIAQITTQIRSLSSFPQMGTPVSSIMDVRTDYRFLPCGHYLVFYRVSNELIYVSRVLYGKRDYIKILLGHVIEEE
jgi:toxin ParE1/3/4